MADHKAEKVWFDGELVPWDEATVHVTAHVMHYGSSVFEGIRAYASEDGPAVFCLDAHILRLFNSAKIYRMEIPYTPEEIKQAILDTILANGHSSCYIRPLVFRGAGSLGVNPLASPVDTVILTFEWGAYLGPEALEQGVDVGVSSWRRMAPNTFPAAAKIGGQYINSQFIVMEAVEHGYVEGIALDVNGLVSEGSGENIFVVTQWHHRHPAPVLRLSCRGSRGRCVIHPVSRTWDIRCGRNRSPASCFTWLTRCSLAALQPRSRPSALSMESPLAAAGAGPSLNSCSPSSLASPKGKIPDRHGWLTPCRAV